MYYLSYCFTDIVHHKQILYKSLILTQSGHSISVLLLQEDIKRVYQSKVLSYFDNRTCRQNLQNIYDDIICYFTRMLLYSTLTFDVTNVLGHMVKKMNSLSTDSQLEGFTCQLWLKFILVLWTVRFSEAPGQFAQKMQELFD